MNHRTQHFLRIATLLVALSFLNACGIRKSPSKEVVFLAVNDIHAAIEQFPRFAYMADSLRLLYPNLLVVSAGDHQTGNPINDQNSSPGLPVIELMNTVGVHLSALGNHEFDPGQEMLALHLRRARFPYICSNVRVPSQEEFPIKPNQIVTLPNGLKIAFTSVIYLNNNFVPDSHPDKLVGFQFFNPDSMARQQLHLRDSCHLLVFLNHYGFEKDMQLLDQLPPNSIDLIIGGHSHTLIDTLLEHRGTLVTQAQNKLRYASLIKVKVGKRGVESRSMQLLPINRQGRCNPQVQQMVDRYSNNPFLTQTVAHTSAEFSHADQLGYLMADGQCTATQADFALVNKGGVRLKQLPHGEVSRLQIYSLDPFGNEMILMQLSGKEVKDLITRIYLQDASKITYPSKDLEITYLVDKQQVLQDLLIKYQGAPIDPNQSYTVAINSYMSSAFGFQPQSHPTPCGITSAEALLSYLSHLGTIPNYQVEKKRIAFTSKQ